MKNLFKSTILFFGLGPLVRASRQAAYNVFDFTGGVIFALLRACRLLPRTGKFDKNAVKKILIIRTDRIGDVILSTPALRAVRKGFPGSEIHLLVVEKTKDLVCNNPDINSLKVFGRDSLDKDYDLAIALHPGFRQNRITFTSGAKSRIGYTGRGGGFYLTQRLKDDRATRVRHEVESALETVFLAGCVTEDKGIEISVTKKGEKFAEAFFRNNKITSSDLVIVVHPGARQKYIRWKKKGFAEVADRLIRERSAKVILTGGGGDDQVVCEVRGIMKERPFMAVDHELTELVSLIKKCSLFIGNSTGPMHIAAALGVPTVAIFGPIHPLDSYCEWGPWSKDSVVVSKDLSCKKCHPTDCKTFDCMKQIQAEDVLKAVDKVLRIT